MILEEPTEEHVKALMKRLRPGLSYQRPGRIVMPCFGASRALRMSVFWIDTDEPAELIILGGERHSFVAEFGDHAYACTSERKASYC